jgi:plasmid stabilization system protein ParE
MRTIKIAAAAQTDLVEIAEFIVQDNAEAARKIIKEITAKSSLLRDNPFIGREQNKILELVS